MDTREIIQTAWRITSKNNKLMWYGFIPAVLGTLVGLVYALYQGVSFWAFFSDTSILSYVTTYGNAFLTFATTNIGLTIGIAVLALIIFLAYLFVPMILHGGLIKITPKVISGEDFKYRTGLPYGLMYFFPLFQYKASMSPFNVFSLVFFAFTFIRTFGFTNFANISVFFVLFFILDLIFLLFFTFAEYFIVLHNQKYFQAMRHSMKLVFMNMEETFFLMLLMLLIGVRILLNIIGVLLVPGIILFFTYFLASGFLHTIGLWLGILVGVGGVFFMSYLTGVFSVFITAVWVLTLDALLERTPGFEEMCENELKAAESIDE